MIKVFNYALEKMATNDLQIVINADKRPAGEHVRRFNAPTTNEVAIPLVNQEYEKRDILLRRRDSANFTIIHRPVFVGLFVGLFVILPNAERFARSGFW